MHQDVEVMDNRHAAEVEQVLPDTPIAGAWPLPPADSCSRPTKHRVDRVGILVKLYFARMLPPKRNQIETVRNPSLSSTAVNSVSPLSARCRTVV